jgi:hypothetical protein
MYKKIDSNWSKFGNILAFEGEKKKVISINK